MRVAWRREGESLTGVVDSVDDSRVNLHEQHGGILNGDLHGLDESINKDIRNLHVALIDLGLGHEAFIARELAKTLGAAKEQVGAAGFREQEEHDDGHGSRHPDGLVERPAPGLGGDGEAREEGAESSWIVLVTVREIRVKRG